MKQIVSLTLASSVVLVATAAFADCVDGVRKATEAEAAYFQKVQAALKEVLPVAPAGWTVTPSRDQILGGQCTGTPEGTFSISVDGKYTYRPPKEEADRLYAEGRKVQTEIDALEKLPPDIAKERDEAMAKHSEKTRAARQAEKDGNKELSRQLYTEREVFDKQAREVRNRHLESVKNQVDQLRAKLQTLYYGPQDVVMRVSVNEQYPHSPDPQRGSEVVVGKVPAPKSPGLKVQGVRMVLEGPTAKRQELMSVVDKAKLERLLQ